MFDTAADDVAVGDRDTVSDSIATVDDHPGHDSLPLLAVPARGQSENCLHGDIEARYIECFEHDFRHVFSVFRCVQRRFREQEMVILRLRSKVLEYTLFPKPGKR